MENLTTLFLKIPRNTQVTPESAQTFLATLTQINMVSGMDRLFGKKAQALSLEIVLINQQIRFFITCNTELVPFVEAQLKSNYPLAIIEKVPDPLENQVFDVVPLTLRKGNYYPLAVYSSFVDIDPLSSVLSVLSKGDPSEFALIQIALAGAGTGWQTAGQNYATYGVKKEDGTYAPHPDAAIIKEKISYPGFKVSLRLASNTKKTLTELTSTFGVFTRSDGNSFKKKKVGVFSMGNPIKALRAREVTDNQILNILELSTIWHLPSEKIKTTSIAWGTSVLSEPPDNLPVALDMPEEEKQKVNFFARTQYKNMDSIFGIKDKDRRRHIWVVGKTGTGKSTMIQNMVIDDFKKDRGVGIIDPHGDSCETLLSYIPRHRINDTIYFNPADREFPIHLNPLEVVNREEGELVVSGIMAVFTKVWANVWSARMEYILRNSLLTLVQIPDTTLGDVLSLLSNKKYRDMVVSQVDDPNLARFWRDEYDKMPDKLQKEAIAPIQNKVGQFVTSPLIRRIIGHSKSSINLDEIMDGKKIFLANLSQGRIGEDNAALLGAMLITKFQSAAMHRVDMPEDDRQDFYLYVDEFQNFATESFIKILSEARKYRLDLMLANQYMAQIPEDVQKAILGNVGSLVCFGIGAEDAGVVYKEFAEVFTENDLVNLSNYQIALKLMIDGHASRPFFAHTLPLPQSINQNKDKVVHASQERWGRKIIETPRQEFTAVPSPLPTENAPNPPSETQRPPQNQNYQQQQFRGNRPRYHNNRRPYPRRDDFRGGPNQPAQKQEPQTPPNPATVVMDSTKDKTN
jgi:hypothetical protein